MKANTVSKTQYLQECNRCLHCAKPICRASCPIGNDIPSFVNLVRDGRMDEAVESIGHPFGEICGYICPHEHTCQGGCVLAKRGQALQMGQIERAVFAEHPYRVTRKGDKLVGRKIAVVGGGVAGITFAAKTYEQGADVTIFERDELLSTLKLIPSFRLPREALLRIERECDGKFTVVKKAVTSSDFAELQRSYDIVYVAIGASNLYGLGIAGDSLATPYDVFLKNPTHSGKIVVIGGGNTAMDCARLAKRQGLDVTVAYRRQRADMPAFDKEVNDAENDGVKFLYNVAPVKLVKEDKLHLTLAKTISEGRGKLTVTSDTSEMECDTVVSALGSAFDNSIYSSVTEDSNAKHPLSNVYVGGDAVGGKTVAEAVADAIQAAQEVAKLHF